MPESNQTRLSSQKPGRSTDAKSTRGVQRSGSGVTMRRTPGRRSRARERPHPRVRVSLSWHAVRVSVPTSQRLDTTASDAGPFGIGAMRSGPPVKTHAVLLLRVQPGCCSVSTHLRLEVLSLVEATLYTQLGRLDARRGARGVLGVETDAESDATRSSSPRSPSETTTASRARARRSPARRGRSLDRDRVRRRVWLAGRARVWWTQARGVHVAHTRGECARRRPRRLVSERSSPSRGDDARPRPLPVRSGRSGRARCSKVDKACLG